MSELDDIPAVRLVAGRIRWNGRLAPFKLRDLYENDAAGIRDEELLDDIASTFFARCMSIRAVTAAHYGKLTCAQCLGMMERGAWEKEKAVTCDACGWETTWGTYLQSYQKKQLFGGAAFDEYMKLLEDFPKARGYTQKMQVVDRLVHAFHIDAKTNRTSRPAPVNLIEGTLRETLKLLDELAAGDASTEGVTASRKRWGEALEDIPWLEHVKFRRRT